MALISNSVTVSISATSALGAAVVGMTAGQSKSFAAAGASSPNLGPPNMSAAQLEWQAHSFIDTIHNRVTIWGKDAAGGTGWALATYSGATDSWTPYSNLGISEAGHVYGQNTFDPVTGDQYLYTNWGGAQPLRRVLGSDGSFGVTSTDNTYSYNNDGTIYYGVAWHPNLFGAGDGGVVYFSEARIHCWRKSTGVWTLYTPGGLSQQKYAQAMYLPSQDAVFRLSAGGAACVKVTPGPTFQVFTPTGQYVGPNADSATTFATSVLHLHPADDSRLWIICNAGHEIYESTNGMAWSKKSYTHPFNYSGNGNGYTIVRLTTPYNVYWRLNKTESILWRPTD